VALFNTYYRRANFSVTRNVLGSEPDPGGLGLRRRFASRSFLYNLDTLGGYFSRYYPPSALPAEMPIGGNLALYADSETANEEFALKEDVSDPRYPRLVLGVDTASEERVTSIGIWVGLMGWDSALPTRLLDAKSGTRQARIKIKKDGATVEESISSWIPKGQWLGSGQISRTGTTAPITNKVVQHDYSTIVWGYASYDASAEVVDQDFLDNRITVEVELVAGNGLWTLMSGLVFEYVTRSDTISFEAGVSLAKERDVTFNAAAKLRKAQSVSFFAAATLARTWLPTTKHQRISTKYRVLAEIDWGSGTKRYATHSLAIGEIGFDGRLMEVPRIVLGTNGERGQVSLRLQNLPQIHTIESLWSDANPPEGVPVRIYYWFEGDTIEQRIEVFRGNVEEVVDVSEDTLELSAFSAEEMLDLRMIGREINEDDYPDAPKQSLGQTKPIVFGTVPHSIGLPLNRVGRTNLRASALRTDTIMRLADVTDFSDAGGFVGIGDEVFGYGGRDTVRNNLTGCTTRLLDYSAGTSVVEIAELQIIHADHPCVIGDVYGVVGERFEKIDTSLFSISGGIVTFPSGWPTLSVPSGSTQFAQIQTTVDGPANTAVAPLRVCADAPGWDEKVPALIDDLHRILEVETGSITPLPLGTILRVYATVEYDDSPFNGADERDIGGSGGRAEVLIDSTVSVGFLLAGGNLPSEILQKVGLGETRAYDDTHTIVDDGHSHANTGGGGSQSIACGEDFLQPIFVPLTPAAGTLAFNQVVGGGGYYATNLAEKRTSAFTPPPNSTITKVVIKFVVTNNLLSVPLDLRAIVKGYFQNATWTPVGAKRQSNNQAATIPITRGFAYSVPSDVNVEIQGELGITPNDWSALSDLLTGFVASVTSLYTGSVSVSASYEVTWAPLSGNIQSSKTGIGQSSDSPLTHTVAFLADVTQALAGFDEKDWTATFANRSIRVSYSGTGAELRVKRVSFLVEYAPHDNVPCDRILADVEGIASNGNPADILRQIISHPDLLALDGSTFLNSSDYFRSKRDLGSYRLDFTLTSKVRPSELIRRVADQGRLLWFWEYGALVFIYEKSLVDLRATTPLRTFRKTDMRPGNIKRKRTVLRQVITEWTGKYAYDYQKNKTTKVAKKSAPSTIGTPAEEEEELGLIIDEATAQSFSEYRIERKGKARFQVTIPVLYFGLDIRRGSVIAVEDDRNILHTIQVLRVDIGDGTVDILGTVWDSL
jgi:hypothetical protein